MLNFLQNKNIYYFLLLGSIIFHSIISYENLTFNLYFNSLYEKYSLFFKSFDFSVFTESYSTFPIWGYGLFHLLGKNILVNLIIQQLLCFFSLVLLDKEILKFKIIDKIELFRFLIIISAPLFLFHTQMWPNSFASSLFILSILFLHRFFKTNKITFLISSAILYGIMQNFRSDYIYLFYLITIFILITKPFNLNDTIKKTLFPITILSLLIPWMIFSYYQTGKPLLTSTNGGHVLFTGLGQLPNNIWGITPHDEDSVKTKLLIEKFGDKYKYLDYEAWNGIEEDEFLKTVFFNLVIENPKEWIRKCFFSFRLLVLDPFYVGNVGNYQQDKFSNIIEIRKLEKLIYRFKFNDAKELILNTSWQLSFKEIFQFLYTLLTKIFGVILFTSFLIITLLSLYKFGLNIFKEKIITLLFLIISYQIAISVFAFHMPVYNTTIYIVYLLLTYLLFQKYLSIRQ